MSRVRILVLTSSTGGGHDARAAAFAEWCFQLYQHQVDVRIEQMLEKSSTINKSGVAIYNWIQGKAPFVHIGFYTVIEGLSIINTRRVSFGASYYETVLRDFRPHLVFSVHDCLNRGYFQMARKILGPKNVRCATYCGEFSGGWGYSRNWIEPTADLYISRTPTARDFAIKHGIAPERSLVRGSLMRPRSYLEVVPPGGRGDFRMHKLGLRPDLFTLFLATGGNGANNHLELLTALLKHAERCQAIVICGRNKQAFNELMHWRSHHPEFICHIQGYSDEVHLLMQASDVIITRGGTTTCAKALHFRCPIIFNAFGGIMPQERLTWKFFRNGANSRKIESVLDFSTIIDAWMEDPALYWRERDAFSALRYDEDPTVVIRELIDLASEVEGESLVPLPFMRP